MKSFDNTQTVLEKLNNIWDRNTQTVRAGTTAAMIEDVKTDIENLDAEDRAFFTDIIDQIEKSFNDPQIQAEQAFPKNEDAPREMSLRDILANKSGGTEMEEDLVRERGTREEKAPDVPVRSASDESIEDLDAFNAANAARIKQNNADWYKKKLEQKQARTQQKQKDDEFHRMEHQNIDDYNRAQENYRAADAVNRSQDTTSRYGAETENPTVFNSYGREYDYPGYKGVDYQNTNNYNHTQENYHAADAVNRSQNVSSRYDTTKADNAAAGGYGREYDHPADAAKNNASGSGVSSYNNNYSQNDYSQNAYASAEEHRTQQIERLKQQIYERQQSEQKYKTNTYTNAETVEYAKDKYSRVYADGSTITGHASVYETMTENAANHYDQQITGHESIQPVSGETYKAKSSQVTNHYADSYTNKNYGSASYTDNKNNNYSSYTGHASYNRDYNSGTSNNNYSNYANRTNSYVSYQNKASYTNRGYNNASNGVSYAAAAAQMYSASANEQRHEKNTNSLNAGTTAINTNHNTIENHGGYANNYSSHPHRDPVYSSNNSAGNQNNSDGSKTGRSGYYAAAVAGAAVGTAAAAAAKGTGITSMSMDSSGTKSYSSGYAAMTAANAGYHSSVSFAGTAANSLGSGSMSNATENTVQNKATVVRSSGGIVNTAVVSANSGMCGYAKKVESGVKTTSTGHKNVTGASRIEAYSGAGANKTTAGENSRITKNGGQYNITAKNNTAYVTALAAAAAQPGKIFFQTQTRLLYQTDAGQGIRKVVLVGQLAKSAVILGNGIGGVIVNYGKTGIANVKEEIKTIGRAISGRFNIDGERVAVPSNFRVFSTTGAKKKYDAFVKKNSSLVKEFTKAKNGKLDIKKLNKEITSLRDKVSAGKATIKDIKRLASLEKLYGLNAAAKNAKLGVRSFSKIGSGMRGMASTGRMIVQMANPESGNAAGMMLASAVLASKTFSAGVKVTKLAYKGVVKPAITTVKKVGKWAAKNTKVGGTIAQKVAAGKSKITVAKVNLKGKIGNSSVGKAIKNSAGKTLKTARKSVNSLVKKVAQSTIGKAVKKVSRVVGKTFKVAGKVVAAPLKAITKIFNAFNTLKKYVIGTAAVGALLIFFVVLAGTAVMSIQYIFMADDNTLQSYVNYAVKIAQKWEDGELEDSTVYITSEGDTEVEDVDGDGVIDEYDELLFSTYDEGNNGYSLTEIYNMAGSETGRWRLVTTTYLDEDGNEVDGADNIKEILSMIAVKIDQNWVETDGEELSDDDEEETTTEAESESETDEEEEEGFSKSDIKKMIKYLYLATHSVEVVQSDAYAYTKEVNNSYVYYLYEGETEKKIVTGDAEGEGCRGPRTFYCTEDSEDIPDTASEYRLLLSTIADYNAQGGCEIEYQGAGIYYSDTDTFEITGSSVSGTTVYENAHEQVWATDEMIELYELSQENGGQGDEYYYIHGEEWLDTLPSDCEEYETQCKHTGISVSYPATGCTNYSFVLPDGYWYMSAAQFSIDEDELPSSLVLTWDDEKEAYIFTLGEYKYKLSADKITDSLTFYYISSMNAYMPAGTTYYCQDIQYKCLEKEYCCYGHTIEEVTIYYCPGHEEYWCDGNHYDLNVYITIAHTDDDSIYYADVENDYDYKRKAVAVSEYPDDFDRLNEQAYGVTDDGDGDDFYWSDDNQEWCEDLANTDWQELYEIYGLEDISTELDEDNIDAYLEYLEITHIYSWGEEKLPDGTVIEYPEDENGGKITFSGSQWFYDETREQYVKLEFTYITSDYNIYSYEYYEIIGTSDTNPLNVSDERVAFVKLALSYVGLIPYEEGGRPDDWTLSDFGTTEDGTVIRGLDSGGFVNFVLNNADLGFTVSNSIRSIWNNTYSIDGTETTVYYGNGNLDDLSTVDWSEYEDASELRQYIVDLAISYCGQIPYVWGGASLTTGCDCSGFVGQIYAAVGILSQSSADSHAYVSSTFRSLGYAVSEDDVQPGDILCYEGHVAIYVDSTHIVHARGTAYGLEVTECNPFTYHGGVITIRSLITDENDHLAEGQSALEYTTTTVAVSSGTGLTGTALEVYEYFSSLESYHLKDIAIAGVLGNIYAESGMIANNLQDSYESVCGMTDAEYTAAVDSGEISKSEFINDGYGYGLFQFTSSGKKEYLYEYTVEQGLSIADVEGQCEAVYQYLCDHNGWTHVANLLNAADSASDAATLWHNLFELSSDTSMSKRQSYASQYYSLISGKSSLGAYEDDLLPGDLVFINTYYERESDDIPYNQVAIYLGENELGEMLVICCSASTGYVSVITTSAFRYYRRLECW